MTGPNLFLEFNVAYGFLTIIYAHTIKDNLAHRLNQFLYVKPVGVTEALTFISAALLGEVIDTNFHLPLLLKRLGDLTSEDLESALCFPHG